MPILYNILKFIILAGFFDPSFIEFNFYYSTNVRGITKTEIGLIATGSSVA